MIKVGDRVVPFFNMGQEGVVTEIRRHPSKQWTVGGTVSSKTTVVVLLNESQKLVEFKLDDLRIAD